MGIEPTTLSIGSIVVTNKIKEIIAKQSYQIDRGREQYYLKQRTTAAKKAEQLPRSKQVERHHLAVTHGQDTAGFIDQVGRHFTDQPQYPHH